ncbi:hypothetical protein B0H17DRAFT_1099836 [Mycena rosella]|uniref:BTB domain transcription factor n=1 Tax=Mycena rosella TaxID=1033263 RepID=A0AAD7CN68_MYCRO|nr:hypothetical protein B0H17DRAFT_1099836 [Mycena rosella]
MVTTRKQEIVQAEEKEAAAAPDNLTTRPAPENSSLKPTGTVPESSDDDPDSEPPAKKVKIETPEEEVAHKVSDGLRDVGTTERGHIYFFFRPRVQMDSPASLDDVKNLHMLLVPRPPKFGVAEDTRIASADDSKDMDVLPQGADAVPASAPLYASEKHYRLITIGKKTLPDPGKSRRGGRKESFWATVTAVGDDLDALEKGLSEKTYGTKTRGTRHDPPARLAARGCYALVNNDAQKPSAETTYLGYSLSHPAPAAFGPVQTALGIHRAAAFVLQVKNPQAPASDGGASTTKHVVYPPAIMDGVFGQGTRGRDATGLRFAPCTRPEMLDYKGVELLLIAVRGGEVGLEESLGEGRGEALAEAGEEDEVLTTREIFGELWGEEEGDMMPEALDGEWI